MPGNHRAKPEEALLFLGDICQRLTIVTPGQADYLNAIQNAAANGTIGGGIYDALLVHCAKKANAEVIYTWNIKHFARLSELASGRVRTPGEAHRP